MPRLVTALLVKDEADKYLERVLKRCLEFSDEVIMVDDGSTDGSDRMAWRLGCNVKRRSVDGMWGNEAPARAELWDHATRAAGDGWVLICDADMILHGDPRPLTLSRQCNSWSWPLFDIWTEDERMFRHDGYWQGHAYARPWMFRPRMMDCSPPIWPDRGIHTGHCPQNSKLLTCVSHNLQVYWIHLAYSRLPDRLNKHRKYLEQAHQLSGFELGHANSILD